MLPDTGAINGKMDLKGVIDLDKEIISWGAEPGAASKLMKLPSGPHQDQEEDLEACSQIPQVGSEDGDSQPGDTTYPDDEAHYCRTCELWLRDRRQYDNHLNGNIHKKNKEHSREVGDTLPPCLWHRRRRRDGG